MTSGAIVARCVALGLALLVPWPLATQPLPAQVRAEIEVLLDRLQSSGCEFERNGTLHTATQAREHLLGKLAYLERRAAAQTTEQFIDQGASRSSSSGKPYRVLCAGKPTLESGAWLQAELQRLRAAGKAPSAAR